MSKIEKTEEMFCYQCEQRAGCSGCTGARGVCGKSSKTALLQDKLTGSLVALAEAVGEQNVSEKTNRIMIEGLFATLTNVNFDDEALEKLIETALKEKRFTHQDVQLVRLHVDAWKSMKWKKYGESRMRISNP